MCLYILENCKLWLKPIADATDKKASTAKETNH